MGQGHAVGRRAAVAAAGALALAALAGCSGGGAGAGSGGGVNAPRRKPTALDSLSWGDLAALSAEIAAAPDDASADEVARAAGIVGADGLIDASLSKSFELADGSPCSARVVGIRHDALAGGGVAGLSLQLCSPLARRGVVEGRDCEGGWEGSALRAWLNGDALDLLPAELAALVAPAEKPSAAPDGSVSPLAEALWLPSEVELGGEAYISASYPDPAPALAEGAPYRLFLEAASAPGGAEAALVRPDASTGAWTCWWERTLAPGGDGFLFRSYAGGHTVAIDYAPNFRLGVVPGFCL